LDAVGVYAKVRDSAFLTLGGYCIEAKQERLPVALEEFWSAGSSMPIDHHHAEDAASI